MQGTLSEGVLPGLLRELYVGRKSGILHFTSGDEERGVRFRKGNIVNANTSVEEERLGATLLRNGLLPETELARATEVVLRDKKRLGVVLQELAVMDRDRLEDALAIHVREVLSKVLARNEGSYSFEEQDAEAPVEEDTTLKLSTGEVILEAVRRVQDPDVIRYALGNLDRILGLSNDPLLRFQRISLNPVDGYVLSRIDGTLSAREILQLIPMVPEDTLKSLYGLLCTGVVEYLPGPPKPAPRATPARPAPVQTAVPHPPPVRAAAPTPPAPPPSAQAVAEKPAETEARKSLEARRQEVLEAYEGLNAKNHFEVLGIPRASSEAQVKDAYFRLAKRFHPDTHHDPSLVDLADRIEAIFIRLGEAYEVLRHAHSRSSYESDLAARTPRAPAAAPSAPTPSTGPDPAQEARAAEESIRKADRFINDQKYWDAIQLLEAAIPAAQGKLKHRARVLLSKALLKNPHWVKRAEEQLQTVVKDDPQNAEAYFLLGTIYKGGGLKSRALSMFRKALELKPDHEAAAAEMVGLAHEEPAPAPESGGLLKKLFGRT